MTGIGAPVREALRTVLAPLGRPVHVERLTGGMFATTYRARLADGARVVVKTAPTGTDRLLTYELDLLRTEAAVYGLAGDRPDLLMPTVLLTDFSRSVLPTDVLVVSHLDGVPLVDAGELGTDVQERVQEQLGALMGRLHTVAGDRFGYPNAATGLVAPTWSEAFGLVVGALLDDAARWGTELPADRVRAAVARSRDALDEVTVPSLVHTDLWAGNLFVDPGTWTLVGVIDTERALWGDPLLELVGADQLGLGPVPPPLLRGYRASGAALPHDTPSGATRLLLYRMWISLVLLVEIAPRGYAGEWLDHHRTTAARNLRTTLDRLDATVA